MTEGQLALAQDILEKVKEGKKPSISNVEKVDLDSVTDYFNNLLLDIEKQKKKNFKPVIFYRLGIEISK